MFRCSEFAFWNLANRLFTGLNKEIVVTSKKKKNSASDMVHTMSNIKHCQIPVNHRFVSA